MSLLILPARTRAKKSHNDWTTTTGSPQLTRLGGGAFGNKTAWIDDAIRRALTTVEHTGLDIRLVDFGGVDPSTRSIVEDWR